MHNKFIHKNIIHIHQIGFPINIENIILEDDSVRLLYEITEGLDYTELHKAYSTLGRNPAISPESLFRILIYGYMEGIYSSRKLEKACNRDINFKWLLQGQKPPTHNTIARFRSKRLVGSIENLFSQLIIKLGELNEIEFENIFIDGTKIEVNANRYTFVWRKATDKFESKLQEKMNIVFNEIIGSFNLNTKIRAEKISTSEIGSILAELNSIKENHMQNGQLKPAYNVQIGVEGEYIVGIDISNERSDKLAFIPFLERLESNLNKKYEGITADAGYESEENYTHLEKKYSISFY